MQALKINILLLFALFMFAAKPFIGFSVYHFSVNDIESSVLSKSFTKRKQEFVEDSDFDIIAIQQRLTDPAIFVSLVFSFFLNKLLKYILSQGKSITGKLLSDIRLSLFPPGQLYLRTGKLSI